MFDFLVIIGKITLTCIASALYAGFIYFSFAGLRELRQRWISKQLIDDEQNER